MSKEKTVTCKCDNPDCGKIFEQRISKFKRNKQNFCSKECKYKARKPSKKRIDMTGNKYGRLTVIEMLYHYKGEMTYCRCICECGNETTCKAQHLRGGKILSCGCLLAERRGKTSRTDETGMKFGRLTIVEIIREKGKNAKVRCLCDCGNEIIASKSDVVNGHTTSCGCLRIDFPNQEKDFSGYVSDYGIEIINRSHKNKKEVWIWNCRCGLCGNIFHALPCNIINGHVTSCGCSKQSSRERLIENYLLENNINFIKQYKFDDCRNEKILKYDFAILNNNNELLLLCEYDGKQHYKAVPMYGGDEALIIIQHRDEIKNKYCLDNGIYLLRLKYDLKDNDIKNIIKETYDSMIA